MNNTDQPPPYKYDQPTLINDQHVHQSYLIWSVLNSLFLSLMCGIVALVFSIKTRRKLKDKLYAEAGVCSKYALVFNIVGVCVGLMGILVTGIVFATIDLSRTNGALFMAIVFFKILF